MFKKNEKEQCDEALLNHVRITSMAMVLHKSSAVAVRGRR